MKRIITTVAAILLVATMWAQAPEKMSYQAVVRDASNALVASQSIGMQISILQGSASGTAVYVETQTTTSNVNGLVSLEIGSGSVVSGTFSTIDWSNGPYFIQTETDPTGGTTYTITGTTQLMSVPYALHAKTAENFTGTLNYTETDPIFGASVANGITSIDITNWNNKLTTEVDGSVTNELQTLSKTLDIVTLSNTGGSFSVNDADADPLNELQDISLSGSSLSLSSGSTVDLSGIGFDGDFNNLTNTPTGVSYFNNDAGYLTSFTEVDGSITNELQTLSKTLDIVTLSNTGGSFSVNDADADPLNELQDISLSGSSLSLSSGSTVDLSGIGFDGNFNNLTNTPTDVSYFNNDAGYLTSYTETDPVFGASPSASITNTLMNNWSAAYTWGDHANAGYLTSFTEVDGSVTNEIQTLSVSGNNLTISGTGGNTVTLPTATEPTYTVGLNPDMGGYIFYVTPDGKHGLVAATQDQSSASNWGNAKDVVNNPANHNADGKKFLDWRLPAEWEIVQLYMNRAAIGGFTIDTPTSYYWTGIEDSDYSGRSFAFLFDSFGPGSSNVVQTATIYVRAVRAF
jgi:hypothetical protein